MKSRKKTSKLTLMLLLSAFGILMGGTIGIFVAIGPNISSVINDIHTAQTKFIILFFVAIFLALFWLIDTIAIGWNLYIYHDSKKRYKNETLDEMQNEDLNNINQISNNPELSLLDENLNYVNDDLNYDMNFEQNQNNDYEYPSIEQNVALDESLPHITLHDPECDVHADLICEQQVGDINNTQPHEVYLKQEDQFKQNKQNYHNSESHNDNNIGNEKDILKNKIRMYVKPGQTMPKGYFFNEESGRIEKLPEYDEIIRKDFEEQIKNAKTTN